jgi:ribosomal peptide maturation radical SAM protein 1
MPTPPRVALVSMPFGTTTRPSIQLGLLQAILGRHRIPATSHYLNLPFAARIGWEVYEKLVWMRFVGEWIFARAAFGDSAPETERYLDAFAEDLPRRCELLGRGPGFLRDLREREAPAFVERCVDVVAWNEYDVVGFTSTFHQNCAALALARSLKSRYPRLITVFGGANFEDEMGLEYVRALPWIDYAVVGEGDEVFPALLERLAAGETGTGLPGVASRAGDGVVFGGRAPLVHDLDALPEPDYSDFFAAATAVQVPEVLAGDTALPFESARGCWWGAKHHCTFCGLNGAGMTYRSKSPARVLEGMDALARRYGSRRLEAVDNILDPRYLAEVFGRFAEERKGYRLFYEVKVNLTQEQLRVLAEAGVRRIQPGIESFSTHLLRLMRKGATAMQNVRFLKWAEAYGMEVTWNVLLGFQGERPEDYERQLAVLRLIPHLQPPAGVDRLWVERFSPQFDRPEAFGIHDLRPEPDYAYIYPDHVDLMRIAYFFDYDAPGTLPPETHGPLKEHIRWWREAKRAQHPPYLGYVNHAGRVTILDARRPDAPVVHVFEGRAAIAHEYCGPTYHTAAQVLAHLREHHRVDADLEAVRGDLAEFVSAGLMLEEDGRYLSLAVPVKPEMHKLFAAVTSLPRERRARTDVPPLVLT